MKIYVGNLQGDLISVTDQDLRDIFETFGEIDYVDIHR
jgi:RNA recognition motif-containing protein